MDEVLTLVLDRPVQPFQLPCFFGMSVNDPILDYDQALLFAQENFANLYEMRFFHPYHQPPRRFSVAEYNEAFGPFLDEVCAELEARSPIGRLPTTLQPAIGIQA